MSSAIIRFLYLCFVIPSLFAAFLFSVKTSLHKHITMLFIWAAVYFYVYEKIIKQKIAETSEKSIKKILAPVLIFNLIIFYLFYFSSFELGIPKNMFRVAYQFGNFMDFITMPTTYVQGSYNWITTGHFPLSYAIAKFFAFCISWSNTHTPHFETIRNGYLITCFLCFATSYPLIRQTKKTLNLDKKNTSLLVPFLLTSYPFFILFERGNFALIGFALLSLFAYNFQKNNFRISAGLLGILAAIKTLNLIMLIFLFSKFKKSHIAIGILTAITITIFSLIYLFGINIQQWALFSKALIAPIKSKVIFSDPNKIFATTGIEAFRALMHTLLKNIHTELSSYSKAFNNISLIAGAGCMLIFYWRHSRHAPWYLEFLFILTVPMVFHGTSGDYNLGLLVPFYLVLLCHLKQEQNVKIAQIYSIVFLLLSGLALDVVYCCGNIPDRSINISPRAVLVPFALTCSMLLIMLSPKKHKTITTPPVASIKLK